MTLCFNCGAQTRLLNGILVMECECSGQTPEVEIENFEFEVYLRRIRAIERQVDKVAFRTVRVKAATAS